MNEIGGDIRRVSMDYDPTLVNDKIELATLYFKTNEYKKALAIYNDLINCLTKLPPKIIKQIRVERKLLEIPIVGPSIHPQLGSIVDQRAATYEKLDLLEKALKDGQLLLKLDPLGCKGYLRQGKILLLLGRELEAYKVYQAGIYMIEKVKKQSKIFPSPSLYQKLCDQYKILNHRLKQKSTKSKSDTSIPAKRIKLQTNRESKIIKTQVSLFEKLPLELISLIFSQLSSKQILNCHLVCREWYNSLTMVPELYERFHCKYKVDLNEFKFGISLMKRIHSNSHSKEIKSLKIFETPTLVHLTKIVDSIISEPGFPIKSLDLYDRFLNFQLILNRFSKFNWRLNNFQNLQSLKLGITSSLIHEDLIFRLFKKLKVLQIISYNSELSGKYNDLVPNKDRQFKKFKTESTGLLDSLEVLILVNNQKLVQADIQIQPSLATYNPYPLYLDRNFPNLTNLTIVSFDFVNRLPEFGEFLLKTTQLSQLTLENNYNFAMLDMFQLLKNYNPQFKLKMFTFRNRIVESPLNLNEFTIRDLTQLQNLSSLDLNGNSLTIKGCKRLLQIVNKNDQLKCLYLGESNSLKFPVDSFHRHKQVLRLGDILHIVPKLSQLHLNDLELDNFTMKQFFLDLKLLQYPCQLKVLDLSFCTKLTGLGLLELMDATRYDKNGEKILKLDHLIIDGVEISKETLLLLKNRGYVNTISNNVNLKRWKQFGKTSWII